MRLFAGILILLFGTAYAAETVGWRNDGSGHFPLSNPPTTWGRISKSVKALRYQTQKPGAEASGKNMTDGFVREWLVLGPVPVPDIPKAIEADSVAGELQLAPVEGDKIESLVWKKVEIPTSTLNFNALLGANKKSFAYAFTNIYSEGGEFTLSFSHRLSGRLIVNGKAIYAGEAASGARVKFPLVKGWNRVLLKVSSDDAQYWASTFVYARATPDYEENNIAWRTNLPGVRTYQAMAAGPGAPIVIGEKIFVMCEPHELFCINKKDGKVLWVRSNSYYDALTAEEKNANPAFKELEPLMATWYASNEEYVAGQVKTNIDQREKLEKDIHLALKKIDRKRFTRPDSQDIGYAGFTPVSDGKFVYAWFASGVTACYDLDGNRKWIRIDNHETVEHGYSSSPVLNGGKLVVFMRELMAFDAATGKDAWRFPLIGPGGMNPEGFFHGSLSATKIGGEDVVIPADISVVRASDGKMLFHDQKLAAKQNVATPVIENGIVTMMLTWGEMYYSVRLPEKLGEKADVKLVSELKIPTLQFPYYYLNWHTASPLVHDGLVYLMNNAGVLTVLDQKTSSIVYQQVLDLDHFESSNEGSARGLGVSPVLAGKHIYFFGNSCACVVIEPGRTFKQIARNKIEGIAAATTWGERQDRSVASPFFDGTRMYFRTESGLYAIGEK